MQDEGCGLLWVVATPCRQAETGSKS